MNTSNYHATIVAKAAVGKAFEKINRVRDWWSKRFEGSSEKAGDSFTVRFTASSGEVWKRFSVVEVEAGKRIVWEVTDCQMPWLADKAEWTGTRLVWELSANNDGTEIRFTHAGLNPEVECYGVCSKGWDYFLNESLLPFLNGGKGQPEE